VFAHGGPAVVYVLTRAAFRDLLASGAPEGAALLAGIALVLTRRLEEAISQLLRIGGGQPTGFGAAKVLSLPDALARTLAEHIGVPRAAAPADPPVVSPLRRVGDLSRECGQATLVYEEGCKKCLSCGFNEC